MKPAAFVPRGAVLRGATVHTCTPAGTLPAGELVVEGGRIRAVRATPQAAPEGFEVIDLTGLHLCPGLIDAHTHLGTAPIGFAGESKDLTEMTRPVTAEIRAIDGIWPGDAAFARARARGITTACVLPGSSNVIGGTAVAVKTAGRNVEKMCVADPVGLKVAFGHNVKHSHGVKAGRYPLTRMGVAATFRAAFEDAIRYGEARLANDALPVEPTLDPIWQALSGSLKVRAHAYRSDDILTALRLAAEFGLRIVIEHAYEAHLVLEEIVEAAAEVVLGPGLTTAAGSERLNFDFGAARVLQEAGVHVALTCDHPIVSVEHLTLQAGLAIRHGMSAEQALRAITYWPARILGLDDRIGSLLPALDADLAIFDGHPLAIGSQVVSTWIEGRQVFRQGQPLPVPGAAF